MDVLVLPPGQTVSRDHYSRGRNTCTSIRDAGGDVTAITRQEPDDDVSEIDVIATGESDSLRHFLAVREVVQDIGDEFDVIQAIVPPNHVSPVLWADIETPIVFGPQESGHQIPFQHFKTILLEKLVGFSLPDSVARPVYWSAMGVKKAVHPIREFLFKETLREGEHIVAVSSDTVADYEELVDVPVSRIPLGVRLETFEFEASSAERTFVCFGHLTTRKSFSTAIRAIGKMEEEAELRVIGSGPQGETLRELVREIGVEDAVTFLGYVDEDVLVREVQNATATVHPSTSEGYFHAQLESLAAGTPIVASSLPLCSDIHSDERIARTCPVGDVDCFARILDAVCREEIVFDREACRTFVEDEFNWSQIGEEYLSLYETVVK